MRIVSPYQGDDLHGKSFYVFHASILFPSLKTKRSSTDSSFYEILSPHDQLDAKIPVARL